MNDTQRQISAHKEKAATLITENRLAEAKPLYESVCALNPQDVEAWLNLGGINGRLGLFEEAEACCHKVIALTPDNAIAYSNMGNVFLSQGKFAEAARCYRQAIDVDPTIAAIHNNLGYVLMQQGNLVDAQSCYERALDIEPRLIDAYYNLGLILEQQGQLDEALINYRNASQNNPQHYNALFGEARILVQQGDYANAIDCCHRVLNIKPDHAEAQLCLGMTYFYQGDLAMTQKHCLKALEIRPQLLDAYVFLGDALQTQGHLDQAFGHYQNALDIDPNYHKAIAGQARIHARHGQHDKALQLLQPLLEKGIDSVEIAHSLAMICRHLSLCDQAIGMMERLLADNHFTLWLDQKISLHFSLGQLYDSGGHYDDAFSHFQQGNQLRKGHYDAEKFERTINTFIETYSKEFMQRAPYATLTSARPIFIVGMPRSGTTLVEQIISSHPQAYGAGELNEIGILAEKMHTLLHTDQAYPQCIAELNQEGCNQLAQRYLERLNDIADSAALRVTDKMPHNFMHLGLIAMLFPEAHIIHCTRDPRDTCLSGYFQDFYHSNTTYTYSCDLTHLGNSYKLYWRLMEHWKSVLPVTIMDVNYEELVSHQEQVTRKILDYCGLPWDDNCMAFYNNARIVTTASMDQVNKPLFMHSVERWKNYEKYLGPLTEALAD